YQKVVDLNPIDIEAWLDYSSVLYEQKKLDQAIEVVSEGIKNNPDGAELYYRMVAYLFASGKYHEALNYLDMALGLDPEKHSILYEYLPQLQENKVIVELIKKYTL